DALSAGSNRRRVQRLVHVRFRQRDVVLEASRHRGPAGMDRAETRITIRLRLDDDAEGDQIVDLLELTLLIPHLAVDGVGVFRTSGDLSVEALFGEARCDRLLGALDVAKPLLE